MGFVEALLRINVHYFELLKSDVMLPKIVWKSESRMFQKLASSQPSLQDNFEATRPNMHEITVKRESGTRVNWPHVQRFFDRSKPSHVDWDLVAIFLAIYYWT